MPVQIVQAPARPQLVGKRSIFLAGTTAPTGEPDWRQTLTDALRHLPVTALNPYRTDWDSTWKEDFSDSRWADQVQWELDMQETADIVVFFFHGATPAPISMLEFGLCARLGKAIVCAKKDYVKRGNIEAVCRRYAVPLMGSQDELRDAVVARIQQDLTAQP
ncbi:hypothetical protein S40285_02961 [Stachybotrys chlorohalonatus IBT 40285]|uniref:Uncharacterized protein n=1 Tax=Stachybotrys chlorohalonatus (strain IBT 40285) TaxID=1283841 RepID=A0A084QK54_STAC4|nr:hypothetical protein S40285_02961 [Stachybotrys chlorohalonata IBT 40285]